MTNFEYYKLAFKNFAQLSGRSRRAEYWYFILVNFLVSVVFFVVDAILRLLNDPFRIGAVVGIYFLAILIPGLSLAIRRLHDVGKSGWYLFIGLIPLFGPLYLLYLMAREGDPRANNYGPNPKLSELQIEDHFSE